jgi:hypothetical protein
METTEPTERSEEEDFLIEVRRWAVFAHRAAQTDRGSIPHQISADTVHILEALTIDFGGYLEREEFLQLQREAPNQLVVVVQSIPRKGKQVIARMKRAMEISDEDFGECMVFCPRSVLDDTGEVLEQTQKIRNKLPSLE